MQWIIRKTIRSDRKKDQIEEWYAKPSDTTLWLQDSRQVSGTRLDADLPRDIKFLSDPKGRSARPYTAAEFRDTEGHGLSDDVMSEARGALFCLSRRVHLFGLRGSCTHHRLACLEHRSIKRLQITPPPSTPAAGAYISSMYSETPCSTPGSEFRCLDPDTASARSDAQKGISLKPRSGFMKQTGHQST